MNWLLATRDKLVVSGTVDNQGRSSDRFEHVVLLSAPLHVLLERVRTRPDNPYGSAGARSRSAIRLVVSRPGRAWLVGCL